ncbi:hypothetical protein Bpfe_004886, partial [Biomphalaria pfeifferi]
NQSFNHFSILQCALSSSLLFTLDTFFLQSSLYLGHILLAVFSSPWTHSSCSLLFTLDTFFLQSSLHLGHILLAVFSSPWTHSSCSLLFTLDTFFLQSSLQTSNLVCKSHPVIISQTCKLTPFPRTKNKHS